VSCSSSSFGSFLLLLRRFWLFCWASHRKTKHITSSCSHSSSLLPSHRNDIELICSESMFLLSKIVPIVERTKRARSQMRSLIVECASSGVFISLNDEREIVRSRDYHSGGLEPPLKNLCEKMQFMIKALR
jgi:hypothetical protein